MKADGPGPEHSLRTNLHGPAVLLRHHRHLSNYKDRYPWLIGYYTDNEIRWVPDIRSKESVLEAFLKKAPESEGYKKAMSFLNERGHTPETITFDDISAFLEIAAAEYGKIIYGAIKRHDKNHLILGSRFNSRAPIPLTRALAPYYDVF